MDKYSIKLEELYVLASKNIIEKKETELTAIV